MSASASLSRSFTSWRANQTSVSSSNTTVTADTAVRLMERISTTPGRPFIAVSTGYVRYCSTSTGDRPGALVMIPTWTLVTSGTASTDIFRRASHERPAIAAHTTSTTPRRRTENSTICSSIPSSAARSASADPLGGDEGHEARSMGVG